MFLGEYKLKFSGQGRIILPKRLREFCGTEIVLSKGFEGCIWGFDLKDWENQAEKQLEVSSLDVNGRFLRRYLFSSSLRVELDNQGRFVIPVNLLQFAKVGDEVVIIGTGDHFEIWDVSLWEKHIQEVEEFYGRLS